MSRSGSAGLRGLDYLSDDLYRRWVRVAVVIALVGYLSVTAADLLVFGAGGRPIALISQGITIVTLTVALALSLRGWSGAAAVTTLTAVWLELQSGIPFTGVQVSALVALPVFVSAAGILLGGRAGYVVAAGTTVSLAALTGLGEVLHPEQVTPLADATYLLVVATASMFAAAALVQLGLDSMARVLRAAHASERRLSDLIRNAPDGIVATDADGRVVSANPEAERLLGTKGGALVGAELEAVLSDAIAESEGVRGSARLTELFAAGSDRPAVPFRVRGEGGVTYWVEARAGSVVWADGSPGRQLTLRDLTERRRAEENERLLRARLEHAQRLEAVGRLAGGVAHEFNDVLTTIGPAAEMLLAETKGSGRALAADILEAKVRGAALTKQLLAFARKDVIQPRHISLTEVATDMEVLLRRFLTERTRLRLDGEEVPTPPVVADRSQIEQIIVNLVINAKDAIEGEGSVTLGVYPEGTRRVWNRHEWVVEGGFVELSVTDDGHGMDPDVLDRVFEPFFSTKPQGKGTGLGLATVHGTVVQNGGEVRILTERGVGTAVIVRWPAAPDAAAG